MDSRPPRLFKYCSSQAIPILEKRSIWFTRVSRFNDPFELFPTLDAYLRPLLTAVLLQRLKADHRAKTLAFMDELLGEEARLLGMDTMLDEELGDEDSSLNRDLRKAVRKALVSRSLTPAKRDEHLARTRRHLEERFGVLCLAEAPDNLLMWSHYAESHRGFVLELDPGDPFFDQRTFPGDPLRCVRKVHYQPGRPAVALFDQKYWLRSPSTASDDLLTYLAGVLLLTKSSDWSYEREWRMILPLATPGEPVPFPPRCLRGVILGSAMAEDVRQRIVEILEEPEYQHVELRRAHRDPRRFRVLVRTDGSVLENRLLEDVGAFPGSGVEERIRRLGASGPKFYEAVDALRRRGLISTPPYDRSKQRKRLLALTDDGRARVAARREAARALEEAAKPAEKRFVEALIASPERFDELLADYLREGQAAVPPGPRLGLDDPKIAAAFARLSDGDDGARWRAATSLREIGDGETVGPLVSILTASRFEELIWLQDPSQAADLEEVEIDEIESEAPLAYWSLADKTAWGSDELRCVAAYALAGIVARITAGEAVEPLIEALGDPEADVRWNAAEALGHLGSPHALPPLERLAEEDDAESSWGPVATAARAAIKRITRARQRGLP